MMLVDLKISENITRTRDIGDVVEFDKLLCYGMKHN